MKRTFIMFIWIWILLALETQNGSQRFLPSVLLIGIYPKVRNAFTGSFMWCLVEGVTKYPAFLCKIPERCWEEMGPPASSPPQPSPRRAKPLTT